MNDTTVHLGCNGTIFLGWLIVFNDILTLVGYLMPNSIYKDISDVSFVKEYFVGNIFKQARSHLIASS